MGTPGLGQAMNYAQAYGLNDQLYALAIAAGLLGLADPPRCSRRSSGESCAGTRRSGWSRCEPPRLQQGRRSAPRSLVPVAILVAWQLWTVHADSADFPRLSTILVEFQDMWLFSQFATHVVPSLERIGLGFGIAVVVGVALGIPLGLSALARKLAMPHIEYWRAMPPPALLPISIVLLHSIGNPQKVVVHRVLLPLPGPAEHDRRRSRASTRRSSTPPAPTGIPRRERIRRIVLPARCRRSSAGMRTSLSLAVIMMVLSEYFSSTSGVGYVLLISKNTFQLGPDVGGDPADRPARLPAQPRSSCSPSGGCSRGIAAGGPRPRVAGLPMLEIKYARQDLRHRREGDARDRGRLVHGRGGRVRLRRRPVGLRQDDAAQVHRRACCGPTRGEVVAARAAA